MLATPAFHHLHLNSIDPDAAIAFYTHQFPSTSKGTWAGLPALLSPNSVLILFNKVDTQPATSPPSAIWHFGWHVTDVRANITAYQARPEVKLLPLYHFLFFIIKRCLHFYFFIKHIQHCRLRHKCADSKRQQAPE